MERLSRIAKIRIESRIAKYLHDTEQRCPLLFVFRLVYFLFQVLKCIQPGAPVIEAEDKRCPGLVLSPVFVYPCFFSTDCVVSTGV